MVLGAERSKPDRSAVCSAYRFPLARQVGRFGRSVRSSAGSGTRGSASITRLRGKVMITSVP